MKIVQNVAFYADRLLPRNRIVRGLWLAALLLSLALLLLPWMVRFDGQPHADWQQFLGRFHPLAVHIPIGLLILVPVLEIAGFVRPAMREAAGFVLGLAFFSCLFALTLGFLLAYGSGDAGPGVTSHMWGGIVLTIAVLACALARPCWAAESLPLAYLALLAGVLLALTWTAHEGGSLTYGDSYLTRYMPARLRSIVTLGMAHQEPNPDSLYAKHIGAILDANCVSCHSEAKSKGGLRLDSYDHLMRGGKDGAVIVAGNPGNSLLLKRITLPPSDKEFMPSEGKPPLKPEEIALIRAWVQQGASPTATTLTGISFNDSKEPPIEPVGDYSSLMPEIRQMDQGQGAKLVQLSMNPADGLILHTVNVASSFGDAQLAQFQKFAPYIVEAELGRTAVTNASFDTLAKFTHLRALHLEGTAVTGNGLQKLAPLSQLTYLNLSGTKVTASAVAPLSSMKNLRHVYLYNTPAQPAPAADAAEPVARSAQ